jgi:DNA processing protein
MNLAQRKVLYYSLCPKVTLSQLKEMESCELDSYEEEKLLEWMNRYHIYALSQEMKTYPCRLLQLSSAPYLFYAVGDLNLLSKPILGIVGPRMMSEYANQVMESFFESATSYDMVTVSGLARGVDQKCHLLSLKHSLPTIAVL